MYHWRTSSSFRRGLVLGTAIAGLIAPMARAPMARAQDAPPPSAAPQSQDLGTVKASGAAVYQVPGTPFPAPPPDTPAAIAPSRAPLEASQPTSVVGKSFIDNSTIPAQNYDELIKFTPSLMNIQPAGPVSQQNYGESIRGFQYNQINTTFDGIVLPGGPSSFAPQSAVYFTSHDLGSVNVERGPGTASQIGYATFGGTIALLSKDPASTLSFNPYGTTGSFNQYQYGLEADTGLIPELNGARGMLDMSHLSTEAYLTGVTTDRNNIYSKWEQPVGDSTLLTFVGMVNDSYGHTAYGSTLGEIVAFGPNYGLSDNPRAANPGIAQAYQGFNTDIYNTDFEYLRIRSDLGSGFGIDETLYTASYFRRGTEGKDPNDPYATNLNGTIYINNVPVKVSDNVPGVSKHNDFRDWGSISRATYDTTYGQARIGLWFDFNANNAYRTNIDFDQGWQVYTKKRVTTPYGAFSQLYSQNLITLAPYGEFAIRPTPELTITPGVKFISVQRDLDAIVYNGYPPGESSHIWSDVLPAIDVHYKLRPDLVVYAQWAQGFLAPPLSTQDSASKGTVTPQTTTNYQIGTAYQTDRMTLAADGYYIPFNNYITSQTNSSGTLYSNSGGATYKGLETEGTVKIAYGVSLYANATVNSATFDNGNPIYQAPQKTAAFGPVFDSANLLVDQDKGYVSILWKGIGKQYGREHQHAARAGSGIPDQGVRRRGPGRALHAADPERAQDQRRVQPVQPA